MAKKATTVQPFRIPGVRVGDFYQVFVNLEQGEVKPSITKGGRSERGMGSLSEAGGPRGAARGRLPRLEGAALWRLRQSHVFLHGHQPPQLLQKGLNRVLSLPPRQHRHHSNVNLQKKFTMGETRSVNYPFQKSRCYFKSNYLL